MTKAPKKILVPVDLSSRSEIAMDYAVMVAAATGASLVVMTNINLPEREVLEELAAAEHLSLEQAGEETLRRLAAAHAPDLETSVVVRTFTSPAEAILEVIDAEGVDLIVIASHGRSGMTRWMLGSVTEKIARHSHVPLVIVPTRTGSQS